MKRSRLCTGCPSPIVCGTLDRCPRRSSARKTCEKGETTGVAAVATGSPRKRTIEIGALCDPISEQLCDIISERDGQLLDRDNDAINQLYVRGYIGDSITAKARKRLLSKCQEAVRCYAEANKADMPSGNQ